MNRKLTYIIFILVLPFMSYSQTKIDKKYILSKWIEMERELSKSTGYRNNFDSLIVEFVDNLKNNGIDTIGIYAEKFVGAYTNDSCQCGIIPWVSFIHWTKDGKTFHQKITKCCTFKSIQIQNSVLIRYYENCMTDIEKGRIMPVITGTSRNKKGEVLFNMINVDHTTWYSIYCDINGETRFISFQQFELESTENIFYQDNISSIINSWRKIIGDQIIEIEKQ
jgi:hypothetical protein